MRGRSMTGILRILRGIVAAATLVCCACSHEERYGRDPAKVDHPPAALEKETIERARQAAMLEEQQPPDDDLSPVGVLFVNGEALTVEDVLKWIRPDLRELAGKLGPKEYAAKLIERAQAEIRSRAEGMLLQQVAERQLKDQERQRLEQFVDGRIREIVNTEHGGRQTRYEEWLSERGLTPADDRARIRREMLIVAHLQRTIGNKVAEPTRRELEQYYSEYASETAARRQRHMLLIDVPIGDTDATGRSVTAPVPPEFGRTKAARALARIRAGEPFAAVAREYSEGIQSSSGGDWGWVTRDGVKPRWQPAVDALYRLEEGEVSDIVESEEACFIVCCADIEDVEVQSFADIQPELVERYKNRQFDALARTLVRELYQNARIRPENPARFLRAVVEAAPQPPGP